LIVAGEIFDSHSLIHLKLLREVSFLYDFRFFDLAIHIFTGISIGKAQFK
jgi:hypothetical protein